MRPLKFDISALICLGYHNSFIICNEDDDDDENNYDDDENSNYDDDENNNYDDDRNCRIAAVISGKGIGFFLRLEKSRIVIFFVLFRL